ncbi:MAG TPA: SH3 domain-containing protein [Chloroflexota bacterium]
MDIVEADVVAHGRAGRIAHATAAYEAVYRDSIVLKAGDVIAVGERDTEWPEFVWCTSRDGKTGWVPESAFERHGATGIAARDYTAAELSVQIGDVLTVEEEVGGWCWCVNSRGERGWVPGDHLAL